MSNHALTVAQLERDLADLFAAFPELAEDEDLRRDTLEGSTAFNEVVGRIVEQALSARTMQLAIDARIEALRSRRDRYERREDALRGFVLKLMERAGLRKLRLPEATVSVRTGRPGTRIVVEADIPDAFMRITKAPNLTAILEALKAGQDVPGATLSNRPPSLTIRTT